jgi:hypothetical protein
MHLFVDLRTALFFYFLIVIFGSSLLRFTYRLNNVQIFFYKKKLNLDQPSTDKLTKWLIFDGFSVRFDCALVLKIEWSSIVGHWSSIIGY